MSPDGKLIALCGRLGEIHLLHSSTKELISTLKMNSKCRVLAFTPDSKTLITHGSEYDTPYALFNDLSKDRYVKFFSCSPQRTARCIYGI